MDVANRTREPRVFSRCGCNALFAIKLDKGDWFVVKYVAKYSHPLANSDELVFLTVTSHN